MKKKIKIGSTFFLLGFCIYIFGCILIETSLNTYGSVLRVIKYLGLGCIILSALVNSGQKINKDEVTITLVIVYIALLNMALFGGGTVLVEMIIIVVSYGLVKCDIAKVYRADIVVLIIGHLLVFLLSCLGIIEDVTTTRWLGDYMGSFFAGEYIRHQFGFLSSNQIPLTLMIVYLLVIAYKKEKVPLFIHVVVQALNIYGFFWFGSRVSFILIILTTVLYYYIVMKMKKNKSDIKIMGKLWIAFPFCALVSFFASLLYNGNSRFWIIANNIFYNRLRWCNVALERYGICLFGNGLEAGAAGVNGESLVDNGYVLVYIQRGIFFAIFVLVLWSYLTYKAQKQNNLFLLLALLILSVASLIDNHLTSYKVIPFYCEFILMVKNKQQQNYGVNKIVRRYS